MDATVVVRLAKLIAVLGFILPWALVSCAGQGVATISGLELALGQVSVASPMTGEIETQQIGLNLLVILALGATLVGVVLSFRMKGRAGLRRTAIAAAVALVAAFSGMMWFKDSPRREMAQQAGSEEASYPGLDAAALAAIRIDEQIGYWLTVIALAGAAGVGFLGQPADSDRERRSREQLDRGTP